ncbi:MULTISPECIES: hypothetical protein [Actibacterium]|uniref:ER-bound oxygenase mpaB/mpaB'/Rubber oxygenase catalytic domain-containing protein n=1 Tax=Actibacterium naphthalenivorans TaxID=1614693 RepID=A0A840CFR0_9RHOB|nr:MULTISPECIES: hypothetical protein [Actibacterium]ALG91511.1 hypothetical protein TQ29_16540 [Actibacterium sp. EMB200-NS6]MBB4022952.1 hypothetical protein [Actibacterium naphthalenivorans]
MTAPKKWIKQEIESLDPEVDYVRIWQLASCYDSSEFMSNMMYALTFPNFVVTDWGSAAVWREDGGKVVERATSRVEQTQSTNALWWWYGPHDERTKKSVDGINRLHAHWAKQYPGAFAYNDDYIYVCAFSAVLMHRFRLRVGAPGVSENEKIGSHKFWGEMSKLFVAENNTPLHGYPEDFEGCLRFCEEFEAMEKPKPERGNLIASAIYEQFVFRYFPEELHWLGHQLIRSLALPSTLKTMQIDPPHPMAQEILPKLMGYILWYKETYEDDPSRSYIENREAMSQEERRAFMGSIRELDKQFPSHFVANYKDDPKFEGCPFHEALPRYEGENEFKASETVQEIERVVSGEVGVAKAD